MMADLEPKSDGHLILGNLKSAEETGGDGPTDASILPQTQATQFILTHADPPPAPLMTPRCVENVVS